MNAIGQEIVVLAVVLAALAYLGRNTWRLLASGTGGGCHSGGCGSCPSGKLAIQQLVAIGQLPADPSAQNLSKTRTPGENSPGASRSDREFSRG